MRPPPALALAALCLLALPAAVAAAYFGLVPAAIPRGSPKPTCLRLLRLLQGQLLPPSGPGCGSISNSDLSFGSTQPHFAVGCRAPSSVSGLPGSDPHRTFQRPTLWSPSLPLFSPLPVRDLIPLTPPHLRALPKLPDSARVSDPDPVRPGAPCPCLSRCRSRALSPSPILTRRSVCPLHGLCLATIFASGSSPPSAIPQRSADPEGWEGAWVGGGWFVTEASGGNRADPR